MTEDGWMSLERRLQSIEDMLGRLDRRDVTEARTLGRLEERAQQQSRLLWGLVVWVGGLTVYVLTGEVAGWL